MPSKLTADSIGYAPREWVVAPTLGQVVVVGTAQDGKERVAYTDLTYHENGLGLARVPDAQRDGVKQVLRESGYDGVEFL